MRAPGVYDHARGVLYAGHILDGHTRRYEVCGIRTRRVGPRQEGGNVHADVVSSPNLVMSKTRELRPHNCDDRCPHT